MRFQKLMWRNMMRSTKSKKTSVLHYNIEVEVINVLLTITLRALVRPN